MGHRVHVSVSYRILISGSLREKFIPERVIRQEDPISPFLFLLCSEGLLASLKERERERVGHILGIRIRARGHVITHLLFADDCYIFSKVKMSEIKVIQECLKEFSKASSQVINHEKSELYFSSNTPRHIRRVIQGVIGMKKSQVLGNY